MAAAAGLSSRASSSSSLYSDSQYPLPPLQLATILQYLLSQDPSAPSVYIEEIQKSFDSVHFDVETGKEICFSLFQHLAKNSHLIATISDKAWDFFSDLLYATFETEIMDTLPDNLYVAIKTILEQSIPSMERSKACCSCVIWITRYLPNPFLDEDARSPSPANPGNRTDQIVREIQATTERIRKIQNAWKDSTRLPIHLHLQYLQRTLLTSLLQAKRATKEFLKLVPFLEDFQSLLTAKDFRILWQHVQENDPDGDIYFFLQEKFSELPELREGYLQEGSEPLSFLDLPLTPAWDT